MVKKTRKKPVKLTAEQKKTKKIISDHKSMIRSILRQTGFVRIPALADKEFEFEGQKSDFDDIYIQENLLICVEYTTSQDAGSHLKSKKIIYDKIENNITGFVEFLADKNEDFKEALLSSYKPQEIQLRILYCSRYVFNTGHKKNMPFPVFLDYAEVRYFKNLTDCVKKSAFDELSEFLRIDQKDIGRSGALNISKSSSKYSGSLLPESFSNFPPDFKIVTFYIDPESLIKRAYVLRKDGWRDSSSLYQRMISKGKIDSIRKYLKEHKRVFVNNIIATLDDKTKILDDNDDTVDPKKITMTEAVKITLPGDMNTIGLIDGQHRTFSYYESVADDVEIASLRRRQNLLVTGIIYPSSLSDKEREKFEARLFLEINSTQTNAKSNLKQAINLVLEPFLPESIATRVFDSLDQSSGPLNGHLERYWFDTDKLKSTSVISYGLKALVKTSGSDSLFSIWENSDKDKMIADQDLKLLQDYVEFCVKEIDEFLIAVKRVLPDDKWTPDKKVPDRFLTTMSVNSLLICLRLLIHDGKIGDQSYYMAQMKDLKLKDFKSYHSSQYAKLAEKLSIKYFP